MNLKFNWGTGILIFILLFLVAMAAFLIFASKQEFNLVEDDYYEKAVHYQKQIDKTRNAAGLSAKIKISQDEKGIHLVFPDEFEEKPLSGKIHFYYPADKKFDYKTEIALDSLLKQSVPLLKAGRYTVKIDWKSEDKEYYSEEVFVVR
jgi:hypothetical protein